MRIVHLKQFSQNHLWPVSKGENCKRTFVYCKASTSAKILRPQEDGLRRCNASGCRLCPITGLRRDEVQNFIRIHTTGEDLQIRERLNCKSKNVLYIITCKKDGIQYAGETGTSAEERFVRHRNTVVQFCYQGTELTVGQHFQSSGHSVCGIGYILWNRIYSPKTSLWVGSRKEAHQSL